MRKKKSARNYARVQKHKDVTINLPINYWQLFKFTYRTNITLLFKISITLALFAIPLFTALYFRGVITTGITKQSAPADLTKNLMSFQGWYGFVVLAAFLILSIGICGVSYVMKRQLRNEGVMFFRDFRTGIKKNCLAFLGITFLYFGFLAILNYVLNLFWFKSEIPYYPILLVIFIIISVLVFMMWTLAVMINMNYKCGFFMLLKSSFLLTFARFPHLLLSLICSVAPLIVTVTIGYVPVLFAAMVIYIAIGFGHSTLLISLINFYIFDELINKRQFPEAYRKGLFSGEQVQPIDEGFHV